MTLVIVIVICDQHPTYLKIQGLKKTINHELATVSLYDFTEHFLCGLLTSAKHLTLF
jgi:hypothetical protein